MLGIVKHRLVGHRQRRVMVVVAASVVVAVKIREVATLDVHPDAVTGEKPVARRIKRDRVFINFTGEDQFGLIRPIAVPGSRKSARRQ